MKVLVFCLVLYWGISKNLCPFFQGIKTTTEKVFFCFLRLFLCVCVCVCVCESTAQCNCFAPVIVEIFWQHLIQTGAQPPFPPQKRRWRCLDGTARVYFIVTHGFGVVTYLHGCFQLCLLHMGGPCSEYKNRQIWVALLKETLTPGLMASFTSAVMERF